MAWNKHTNKFVRVAVVVAVAVAAIMVIAQPDFIRSAGQGIIDWVANLMGLASAPQIF